MKKTLLLAVAATALLTSCGNKADNAAADTDSIAAGDTVAVEAPVTTAAPDTAKTETPEELQAKKEAAETASRINVLLDQLEAAVDEYSHYKAKALKGDDVVANTEKSNAALLRLEPIVTSLAELKDQMTEAQKARVSSLTAKLQN